MVDLPDKSNFSTFNLTKLEYFRLIDALRSMSDDMGIKPDVLQRVVLELLAARELKARYNITLEEALDQLVQRLDVDCLSFRPEFADLKNKLGWLLPQLDQYTRSAEKTLELVEYVQMNIQKGRPVGWSPTPSWLTNALVSLGNPNAPLLCVNCGDFTLVPYLLLEWAQRRSLTTEFVALDRLPETTENLRLMLCLVMDDLEQIRASVQSYSGGLASVTTGDHKFGTAIVDLTHAYSRETRADLEQWLPIVLSERMTLDGRAIILGVSGLLDQQGWSRLRTNLQERMHLEAVASIRDSVFRIPLTTFVSLRQLQSSSTRRATVLAPSDPQFTELEPVSLLDGVVAALEGMPNPRREIVFERATSELIDRWDPKFYCPARLQLQDKLISDSRANWLGDVAQFIARGVLPTLLKPCITTHVVGTSYGGTHGTISQLRIGDQVWLHCEPDNLYDRSAVRVERRSGVVVGYLPAELGHKIAEAIAELGGSYPAEVIGAKEGEDIEARVMIQFSPPEYAKIGTAISVIGPRDIRDNHLKGNGERAWLLSERQEMIVRLHSGDVLLFLRGFGKACVVPTEFEGAICHRDLAIVRPKDGIDPLYLLSFILSPEFQEQLQFVAREGNPPRIDVSDLEDLLVVVPPLAVQRRIAIAFAERRGELGLRPSDTAQHWLDLETDDETAEQEWLNNSSLGNLLGDWDQIHTFDDWLRLKGRYIRELRNLVVHGRSPFGGRPAFAAIMTLDSLCWMIEESRRGTGNPADAIGRIEAALIEFRGYVKEILNSFLRSRFASLANFLEDLLGVEKELSSIPSSARADNYVQPVELTQGIQTSSDTSGPLLEVASVEQVAFTLISPNPYFTGGAVDTPEMFFGRQDVLDYLKANLIGRHQGNVIILQGNRRTGKSSILKQVVNQDLFAPHIPVYIDCQGLGKLTDRLFFFKVAREIRKALTRLQDLSVPEITADDFSEDDPFDDFKQVLDRLTAVVPECRIVVMIDEFEVIDQAIKQKELGLGVLENLRHLFQHRQDLAVILTGSYRLTRFSQEYWSVLFGVGLKRDVGFLDEPATRQLITKPLEGQVTFSAGAVERIIELTACQPYFVQMVCHDLVNVLNRQETNYVTVAEVEEAAQETLTSADGHMRYMYHSVDSSVWQAILVYMASSLSQPATVPLYEIEQFGERYSLPASRSQLEDALREMADRDLVRMEGSMGHRLYGFKIDLVRQWIRRNYDLQSAIALAQKASYIRES